MEEMPRRAVAVLLGELVAVAPVLALAMPLVAVPPVVAAVGLAVLAPPACGDPVAAWVW
jgi:hypothetical protein